MSVDMSSAFDTIDRQTILNVLSDAGCTEDETRLARLLLTNTILRINVNGTLSIEFQTTTGAFQGHAASGILFNAVKAAALTHLCNCIFYLQLTLHCSQPYTEPSHILDLYASAD